MTVRLSHPNEDRYERFRLIEWWNQDRLKAASALVVGAGALGNEVAKNLALLGVGRIWIADFDRIETTNLTRSALFRGSDVGKWKAQVLAAGADREERAAAGRARRTRGGRVDDRTDGRQRPSLGNERGA